MKPARIIRTPLERACFTLFCMLVGAILMRFLLACGGSTFGALDAADSAVDGPADVDAQQLEAAVDGPADVDAQQLEAAVDVDQGVDAQQLEASVDARLEGAVDAAADVDAGLCCLATGAPSCVQVCSFPCTLCLTGGACSHVYQGINYAGTVAPCP